jgi:hypothetical protein
MGVCRHGREDKGSLMARGYVKNGIRSAPHYYVTLRDVEEPPHEAKGIKGLVLDLKLDFRPQADIKEYMDVPPESSSGVSQMFLGLEMDEVQSILRYLNTHGLFHSEWFKLLTTGEKV